MKSQYLLTLTNILFGLSVSVNGNLFKRSGDKSQFHNEMNSKSIQKQENLKNSLPICDMEMFEKGKEIGHGADGYVFDIKRKADNKIFAVKGNNRDMSHEIEAMSRIKGLKVGPDILCAGKDHSFFIMEKVNGIGLKKADMNFLYKTGTSDYNSVSKPERMKLFQTFAIKMFSILKEIHKLNIYHSDAQNTNWMVEKDSLKLFLIDFGCTELVNPQNEERRRAGYNIDILMSMKSLGEWAKNDIGLTNDDMPSQFVSLLQSHKSLEDYEKKQLPTIDEILAIFKSV